MEVPLLSAGLLTGDKKSGWLGALLLLSVVVVIVVVEDMEER